MGEMNQPQEIKQAPYKILSDFVKASCPMIDGNYVWCKECDYWQGKCIHPNRPKVKLCR